MGPWQPSWEQGTPRLLPTIPLWDKGYRVAARTEHIHLHPRGTPSGAGGPQGTCINSEPLLLWTPVGQVLPRDGLQHRLSSTTPLRTPCGTVGHQGTCGNFEPHSLRTPVGRVCHQGIDLFID